jgi:ubiquitin-conjugating enzyme E2 R
MTFPESYPYSAPTFRFTRPIFHPNIYPDGRVCISILHPPGDDAIAGETASERWSPLQCVESVLRSILLLLDDAEINSPANVDASVMYRDNKQAFSEMAQRDVEVSKKDIPEGFVMPTSALAAPPAKAIEDDGDFWVGSDDEDFGGSDSDMDMNEFDEEDDEEESAEDEETEE